MGLETRTEDALHNTLQTLAGEHKLLTVTPNAVKKNTMELGIDELVSLVFSTGGTFAASFATSNPSILSMVGPVSEKPAFFLRHFWEAYKTYQEAKKKGENPLVWEVLKPELLATARTLWMDLTFHDSTYIALAYTLMQGSRINPSILSVIAFLAAIPVAAALEVGAETALHKTLKRITSTQGISWETYAESRFLYTGNADEIQQDLQKKFGLHEEKESNYHDQYVEHRLLPLAERTVLARKRNITGPHARSSLEMIFTTTSKISPDDSQFNYFITHKEKGLIVVPDSKDWHNTLPYLVKKTVYPLIRKDVRFRRKTTHDDELSVCVDTLPSLPGVTVVELKVYKDIEKLTTALDYINTHYHGFETTLPKSELLEFVKHI